MSYDEIVWPAFEIFWDWWETNNPSYIDGIPLGDSYSRSSQYDRDSLEEYVSDGDLHSYNSSDALE